jgi:hypothetical protein
LLVPTKATLFGLDVRFKAVEKKLEDEKCNITTINYSSQY